MAVRVTAPLVIAKDKAGVPGYFYEGSVLPDTITPEEIKRFKADGMVEDVKTAPSAAADGKPKTPSAPKAEG